MYGFLRVSKNFLNENDEICIVLGLGRLKKKSELLEIKKFKTTAEIGCDDHCAYLDRISLLLSTPPFSEWATQMKELLEVHGLETEAKTKLDGLREQIEHKKADLAELEAHIKSIAPEGIEAFKESLKQQQSLKGELQAECDSLQAEIKKAKFFARGSAQTTNDLSMISDSSISYDDFDARIDYTYDDSIVVPFLMALSTNQIITLYGPPGTGKTTLVSKMAKALGAKCTIISVQNSWTDSADLLGYYSPIDRTYEGTAFIEALLDANREWLDKGKDSRLHLICLDEMNLARIEYYFATFLSLLQLPVDKRVVRLLPPYVEEALDDMASISSNNGSSNLGETFFADEQKYLLRLRKYHSFRLPPNVHFIGTINNDDTTNELSPKVRDRSMFISLDSVEPSTDEQLEIEDYYPVSFFDVASPEDIDLPEEFMSENKRFLGYAQTMVGWMMEHMPDYDPYIDEDQWSTESKIYNYLIITKILPVLRKTDDFNYDEYAEAQNVFAEHATSSEYFDLLGGN
jgi:MoxR-like ATPase